MLAGALSAVVVSYSTHNVALAIFAALLIGAMIGCSMLLFASNSRPIRSLQESL